MISINDLFINSPNIKSFTLEIEESERIRLTCINDRKLSLHNKTDSFVDFVLMVNRIHFSKFKSLELIKNIHVGTSAQASIYSFLLEEGIKEFEFQQLMEWCSQDSNEFLNFIKDNDFNFNNKKIYI